MARIQDGTALTFRTSDFPFNFNSIYFGDFRADTNRSHVYYAGSGLIVNAIGANATVTLRESNGKIVNTVDYRGQAQMVFNGEVKSVTYPRLVTTYAGTDQMIQDWRSGAWTPSNGIVVGHPSNVTVRGASFFVMTLQSQSTNEIPEFGGAMVTAVCLVTLVSMLICGGRLRNTNV